ncbi:MAG TPA: type II toxin-antitoxin system VapC family toxin [Allosphingosinicella sp.]|jgi:predicted nucleic acid-binding protein|nr:type II toxin-antitoxin system VapC family toxin [Allosphingosinicella sp.]
MYLLDTNVVSELRRGERADPRVRAWAAALPEAAAFLSVVTLLEIERGILLIERRDAQQARHLRRWFEGRVLPDFGDRIVPIDAAVARRCAALHVPDPRSNTDALIAATALVHGLTVATRNTDDFEATGVKLVNPWKGNAA